jgi:excinuclease ABC subunit C
VAGPEAEPAIGPRLRGAPDVPGVYLMRGAGGDVLYVGKAASLRARLRSYLDPARQGPKTVLLVRQAAAVEWFETDTEVEALILEDSLIKRHRPRYNVRLRDDKTYPFLRLSVQEPFPALTVVRRPAQDGARYFGPYIPAGALRATLRLLRRLFPLRLCRTLRAGRPCLNYQMGRCLAPCAGNVDAERYGELVRGVTLFLQGRGAELAAEFRRRMAAAAEELRYEEAAELRDRVAAIEATLERQRVHDPEGGDFDVAGVVRLGDRLGVSLLRVRAGRLIGTESFSLRDPLEGEGGGEALAGFLRDCYAGGREIPPEVVVAEMPAGAEAVRDWLARERGGAVRLFVPRSGSRRALLAMAGRNALRLLQEERAGAAGGGDAVLEEVGRLAGVDGDLRSLACLDVSNLSGTDAVASLVWWEGGALRRHRYRRFRIRRGGAPDDFAMLAEALGRLAARVAAGSWTAPDAVLLDGGRGQLSAGEGAIAGSAWRPRLLMAIAKPSEKRGTDAVFAAGRVSPLPLAAGNPALALLQRVRDEAHRFAVAYHRSLRAKRLLAGPLSGIPGLGPARQARLLEACGGLGGVRAASPEELGRLLPAKIAAALHAALHPEDPGGGAQARGGAPA